MKNKGIHKYTIEFNESFWLNLVEIAGHGNVKQFIIQALKVALEAHTIKSLILCGGKGTGFRPISVATPSVMLPIGYKPIIEYSIDLLKKHAITDIYLAIGYLKEHLLQEFSEKEFSGVKLNFIIEEKPLDTAGAVLNAKKQFKSTFIVMNGDLITNINLTKLIEFHQLIVKEGGISSMFIIENNEPQVEFDEKSKKIMRFSGSGRRSKDLTYTNAGIYIFEPEVFEYIDKPVLSLEKDVFPNLAKDEILYGYIPETTVYWNHINSPEKYEKGWSDYLAGKLDF